MDLHLLLPLTQGMRAWMFLPFVIACGSGETMAPADAGAGGDAQTQDSAMNPTSDTGAMEVTLDKDIQPIFNAHCTRCHTGNRKPVLTAGKSRAELAATAPCTSGKPYVVSGAPEESFLLYKVGGQTTLAPSNACKDLMPNDKPSLQSTNPTDVDLIRLWIAGGLR